MLPFSTPFFHSEPFFVLCFKNITKAGLALLLLVNKTRVSFELFTRVKEKKNILKKK